ncbi:putative ribonuclease H-like domain-containing protein [Tanacetum coccineum]
MSKTRADYGSGVARPKIEDKDNFELKGQFLKELRTNTFSGSDHEDANEHIKKVLEIVDLFHIPNITIDQVMLRAFPIKYCPPARTAKKMEEINKFQQEPDENLYQALERFKELLMKCHQYYLTEMQEVVLFYNGLDVPTRQILDSRGAIPSKTAADAKPYNTTQNLEKEDHRKRIKMLCDQVGWEQFKGPHNTKRFVHSMKKGKPLKKLTTLNLDKGMRILPIRRIHWTEPYTDVRDKTNDNSVSKSLMVTTVKKKGSYGPQFLEAHTKTSHINNSIPKKKKDPRSFTLPCFINNVCFNNALTDLGASVSVMPLSSYLNLGLGKLAHTKLTVELADRTMKYPKGIAENMLVSIGKFDYPLRENQVDDLMPTIEEGEVVEEFRARNDARIVSKIFRYPSD